MTFRDEVDKILDEHIFKPYKINPTYGASNTIVYKAVQLIDELSASSHKGFCTKTANKIKNKINESNGEAIAPEPK